MVFQSLSRVWFFAIPWTAAHQGSLSFTISWSLLKLMSIELAMPSNHLILLLPSSIFPSIRVFSSESALHIRWSKYWGFCFSISPSNKYSGLISFRMYWFGLLAVQGTLKHHSLKASIFRCQTSLWSSSHTSVHDYWKNQSFDYTDLCWQSEVSAFNYTVYIC